ncbi:hypothetical protein EDD53_0144 [Pacificibacter maritimus]|uniref:TPR repeat protein n=2 Tax=Pacificibacter maritimus TaxID=762213 RepID=A0A3N4UTZ8_9RHOB|nr:hypothetical protein EDD53_0144 [Pacificibacter maritimus]
MFNGRLRHYQVLIALNTLAICITDHLSVNKGDLYRKTCCAGLSSLNWWGIVNVNVYLPLDDRMKNISLAALILSTSLVALPVALAAQEADQAAAETQTADAADAKAQEKADKQAALVALRDALKTLRTTKSGDADAQALALVQSAADEGNKAAETGLAGYLISRDSEAAVALYEKAIASGNMNASFGLAREYWSGRNIEKDREKAASYMVQAVEQDNKNAIYTYASWLPLIDREGGAKAAISLLEDHADILDEEKVKPLMSAAKLKGDLDFGARADVAEWISDLPANQQDGERFSMIGKDKNLYVWLMQDVMANGGHYSGAQNGLLTSSTIRGFASLCADLDIADDCVRGPLNRQSARALSLALKDAAN